MSKEMNDKFFCPICGKDLLVFDEDRSMCLNVACKIIGQPIPNAVSEYLHQMAQALIQSQRDLDCAKHALEEICCSDKDGKPIKGVVSCWLDMDELHKCLAQITHDNKDE